MHDKKKERLVLGEDYDGWVQKRPDGSFTRGLRLHRPTYLPPTGGKWVRVKFVEVKP